jgi:predicted trehalose synthase
VPPDSGKVPAESTTLDRYQPWARAWRAWIGAAFLRSYLDTLAATRADLLPADPLGLAVTLDASLLEKALYEIGNELNHRPSWVRVPLRQVLELLDEPLADESSLDLGAERRR